MNILVAYVDDDIQTSYVEVKQVIITIPSAILNAHMQYEFE